MSDRRRKSSQYLSDSWRLAAEMLQMGRAVVWTFLSAKDLVGPFALDFIPEAAQQHPTETRKEILGAGVATHMATCSGELRHKLHGSRSRSNTASSSTHPWSNVRKACIMTT